VPVAEKVAGISMEPSLVVLPVQDNKFDTALLESFVRGSPEQMPRLKSVRLSKHRASPMLEFPIHCFP
jgi:hypothetical protein